MCVNFCPIKLLVAMIIDHWSSQHRHLHTNHSMATSQPWFIVIGTLYVASHCTCTMVSISINLFEFLRYRLVQVQTMVGETLNPPLPLIKGPICMCGHGWNIWTTATCNNCSFEYPFWTTLRRYLDDNISKMMCQKSGIFCSVHYNI